MSTTPPSPPSSQAGNYDNVAKTLHWIIALAIVLMLALGWIMDDFKGSLKFSAVQLHKSLGITILFLSLGRLGWRLTHHFPTLLKTMTLWERRAASSVHVLFYILIISMPLTGWVMVSASPLNIPTMLYGYIPWPHLPILPTLENKRAIGHFFRGIHGYLAYLMAGLIVLHAGAAWKHHLVNRDDVLLRMAPGFMRQALKKLRGQTP